MFTLRNISATSTNITKENEMVSMSPAKVTMTFVSGFIILAVNAFHIYLLKKKFRREVNPLFIVINHLCLADLFNGGFVILLCVLYVLRDTLSSDYVFIVNTMLLGCHAYGRYLFAVSTIMLDALTVLKMIIVTRNKWYGKSATKKTCHCIWVSMLLLSGIHEGVVQTIMKYSRSNIFILVSALTIISVTLQCTCFARIFYVIKSRAKRNPPRGDQSPRSSGNFLCIAVLQVVAFVLCSFPEAIFHLLLILRPDVPEQPFIVIFGLLSRLNSLVDPIVFFLVYKNKLKTPRTNHQVRFDGNIACVIPRSRCNPRSFQERTNEKR